MEGLLRLHMVHHTEEHTATNNPNQAPTPLQDNQHASIENSVQIHQG